MAKVENGYLNTVVNARFGGLRGYEEEELNNVAEMLEKYIGCMGNTTLLNVEFDGFDGSDGIFRITIRQEAKHIISNDGESIYADFRGAEVRETINMLSNTNVQTYFEMFTAA